MNSPARLNYVRHLQIKLRSRLDLITFTEYFATIDEDRKMLYKHVIPSVNSSSRALDLFNTGCPEMMLTHILPRCNKLDQWNMLSVINWTNESRDYQILDY